jgi:hypothetical protein
VPAKPISSPRGNEIVKNEEDSNGREEGQDKKKQVGRIENAGLEVCQDRKPHAYVAIPQRKLTCPESFGQAEP